ncbi:hypothetical protein RvY_03612 [Ramazzottius varieornatus]|uniref:HAT C-terminal dimerisation domain-containing protein n=1 Tax=Ramazzottius varieornatus TaxID=947166 RepID=A0A1D1US16_RAMVA|nr:hypothetical protein RvY_03612 [Ramazzottius varieornatus]
METKLKTTMKDSWSQEVMHLGLLLNPCVKTNAFETSQRKLEATTLPKKYAACCSTQPVGIPDIEQAEVGSSVLSEFLQTINRGPSNEQTEVDKYLGSSAEPMCKPLTWWKNHKDVYPFVSNGHRFYGCVCFVA